MIRWVAVIVLGLALFLPLFPELGKLRLGRLPGDLAFRLRGVILTLPFGSTFVVSLLAFGLAELFKLL